MVQSILSILYLGLFIFEHVYDDNPYVYNSALITLQAITKCIHNKIHIINCWLPGPSEVILLVVMDFLISVYI